MPALSGTKIIAPITTPDSADTFPTHHANLGRGGWHQVATLVERDAIPAERLLAGMVCRVVGSGIYEWTGSAWEPLSDALGGTTYLCTYGDATPALVLDVPAGQAVAALIVAIVEAWDGDGAALSLGTMADPGAYMPSAEIELAEADTAFASDAAILGPASIYVHITPGLNAAHGSARIQIITTKKGT
ncbi:MAG: hypothetical protein RLZZ524_599 [Pseudomonadota bacterium]|jgi:hypothetical protein